VKKGEYSVETTGERWAIYGLRSLRWPSQTIRESEENMEFFKWKDQFSVKIPEMDKQHQKFFQLLNQIHLYNEKNERSPDFLDEVFREMYSYILVHFAEEETLLEQTGFDGLAYQKKQHRFFCDQLVQLREQHFNGNATVPQSVLNFMRDWILNHILEEDKKYGVYFKNI
jgi:hemerythrin